MMTDVFTCFLHTYCNNWTTFIEYVYHILHTSVFFSVHSYDVSNLLNCFYSYTHQYSDICMYIHVTCVFHAHCTWGMQLHVYSKYVHMIVSYTTQFFIALLQGGYTPLADAVRRGHGDIVHNLIHHYKADPTRVEQVTITITYQH